MSTKWHEYCYFSSWIGTSEEMLTQLNDCQFLFKYCTIINYREIIRYREVKK